MVLDATLLTANFSGLAYKLEKLFSCSLPHISKVLEKFEDHHTYNNKQQMEQKVDLTGDQDVLPTYTAHLVPCKVRYSGPTAEFEHNFQIDTDHHKSLKKGESDQQNDMSHITYIRGRKIAGREILGSDEYAAFLMSSSSDASGDYTMQPAAKVSSIVNYERDGNEDRLHDEIGKFDDFLQLSEVLHS